MWISFIARKYKVRHRILRHLYNKIESQPIHKTDLNESKSVVEDIAGVLKISPRELKKWHMSFHDFPEKNGHVLCFSENGCYMMGNTESGIIAYLDDFWLREGRKDLNDKIYNVSKWVFPILTFIISVLAILVSTGVIWKK